MKVLYQVKAPQHACYKLLLETTKSW